MWVVFISDFFSSLSLRLRTPDSKAVCPSTDCHMCFVSVGRKWWDDNHVQHDPPGLQGGGRAEAHLWGVQQGHTLLKDPDDQTQCLLWVIIGLVSWNCIFSRHNQHKKSLGRIHFILVLLFASYPEHMYHGSGFNCNYNSLQILSLTQNEQLISKPALS